MNEELIKELVEKLWKWLLDYADAWADGDDDPKLLEDMANILKEFPVDIEVPESIWSY